MGLVTSTIWCARMDRAQKARDVEAVTALVDEHFRREEHLNRGERRVGRWWHALFGGELDVNDLEDHQLTPSQLHQRNTVRQQMRKQMLDAFLDDVEEYVPDAR